MFGGEGGLQIPYFNNWYGLDALTIKFLLRPEDMAMEFQGLVNNRACADTPSLSISLQWNMLYAEITTDSDLKSITQNVRPTLYK